MQRLLLAGDYVVTGSDEPPISDGAILVDGERIATIGPGDELRARYPDVAMIGGPGHVVLPGFIDAHQHGRGLTSMQLGVADGPLEEWLIRLRGVRPTDVYLSTALAALRLVRSGVTTTLHHHVHTGTMPYQAELVASLQAYRDVGIRVTFTVDSRDRNSYVYAPDDGFLGGLTSDLAASARDLLPPRVLPPAPEVLALLPGLERDWGSTRLRLALGPQGLQWCSDDLLERVAVALREGWPVHMHLLETRRQREYARRTYGMSAVARLAELGLLGPNTSFAHVIWVDEGDLELLGASGAAVVHNPGSNLRLRSGVAPVLPMLRRRIPVAVGMDGMSLSDRGDYFADLRLCRGLHFDPDGSLEPRDVWRMVYQGGARATFWGDMIGRLAPGCWADAAILRLSSDIARAPVDPGWQPLELVLREASPGAVTSVVVAGRVVLKDGLPTTVDETMLLERVRALAAAAYPSIVRERCRLIEELLPAIAAFYREWDAAVSARPFYMYNSR